MTVLMSNFQPGDVFVSANGFVDMVIAVNPWQDTLRITWLYIGGAAHGQVIKGAPLDEEASMQLDRGEAILHAGEIILEGLC